MDIVNIVILQFRCAVDHKGPKDLLANKAFNEVLQSRIPFTWAQVEQDSHSAVFITEDRKPRFPGQTKGRERILEKILPYLKTKWRVINIVLENDSHRASEIRRHGATDLFLVTYDMSNSPTQDFTKHTANRSARPKAPLDSIPLCLRSSRSLSILPTSRMFWPGGCGDFKGCRLGWTTQAVARKSKKDGHEGCQNMAQALFVRWRDIDAARRFKDPKQRCTGIECDHPRKVSNETWNKELISYLDDLIDAHIAKRIEHWTLVIHNDMITDKEKKRMDEELLSRCRKFEREEWIVKQRDALLSSIKRAVCW